MLSKRADTKTGAVADRLFKQAVEKYAAALKIKPDDPGALNNLGATCLYRARRKKGAAAKRLYTMAEKKLLKAEEISKGIAMYNLACLAARRGEIDECREWLSRAHRKGTLPTRKHLESDSDMEPVRHLNWFKTLLKRI